MYRGINQYIYLSFDTPCDTPADSVNPFADDAFAVDADDVVDDNDVFDFGEFDK